MKNLLLIQCLLISLIGHSQIDTLSTNIYQFEGKLGIGITNPKNKLHIVDSGTEILLGYQPAYEGPYINISGNSTGPGPMLGLSVANKMYYKFNDTLALENWAYLYGNNLNQGIALVPDLMLPRNGIFVKRDGNIGIGVRNPDTKLRIEGNVPSGKGTALMRVRNTATGTHASVCIALESNDGEFGTAYGFTSDSYTAIPDFSRMATISTNGNGFSLQSTSDYGSLRFYTNRGDDGIIERMRINAHGNIGIGTKDPATMLDVNGGIGLGNTSDETAGIIRWTGSDFEGYSGTAWQSLTSGSENIWSTNDNYVFLDTGNVGIGVSSPDTKLRIEGNVPSGKGTALMRVRNTATGTHASVCIALESNDGEFGTAYGFTSDSYTAIPDFSRMATISTNGNGFSLQSTSDYGSLRFYTNRGDDGIIERMRINAHGNIGIGTKDPVTMLDVNGGIRLGNTNDETAGIVRWSGSDFEGYSGTAWQSLTSGSTSNWSANDSSVFLDEVNVGIGTESPESRLQITDGDIYISDIEHGIIMKSPDGQCWRGTLDNSGNLNFTIVGCPGTTSSENAPELNFNDKISVYPNPSNQSITINVSQHYSENLTYQITNLKGQLLDNGTINSPEKQVDISAFPDAIYILSVYEQQGYKITSRKIIKE